MAGQVSLVNPVSGLCRSTPAEFSGEKPIIRHPVRVAERQKLDET